MQFFILGLSAFCAATGQILFKVGATGKSSLFEFVNASVAFGLVLYGISTAIWIFSLSKMRLVDVYAFTALTFVLVYVAGVVFLNEKISYWTGLGVLFVLGGLFLIIRGAPSQI